MDLKESVSTVASLHGVDLKRVFDRSFLVVECVCVCCSHYTLRLLPPAT